MQQPLLDRTASSDLVAAVKEKASASAMALGMGPVSLLASVDILPCPSLSLNIDFLCKLLEAIVTQLKMRSHSWPISRRGNDKPGGTVSVQ